MSSHLAGTSLEKERKPRVEKVSDSTIECRGDSLSCQQGHAIDFIGNWEERPEGVVLSLPKEPALSLPKEPALSLPKGCR